MSSSPTKHQLLSTIACFLSDCSTEEQQNFSSLFTEQNAAIINSSCSSSIPKDFSAIILCGSSVLDTIQAAANLFFLKITMSSSSKSAKPPPLIFITGGIGHSTKFLYETVQKAYPELFGNDDEEEVAKNGTFYSSSSQDNNKPSCVVPESHIFRKILVEIFKIPEEFIIVEDQSTNCGANAELTVPLILEKFTTTTRNENNDEDENTSTSNKHEESRTMKNDSSSSPHTLLLLQDPTMQLRSRLSFEKHLSSNTTKFKIKSICTPFCTSSSTSSSSTERRKCPYDFNDRYVSLIMGEIPRLRNDEKGYGPKGRNFIAACDDIPDEVEDAFRTLEKALEEDEGAKSRKL